MENPTSPTKRVRITREPISQAEIDEVSELYRHMVRSALSTVKYMVKIGEKCCAIKTRLPHGQWGPWVRRNLPFTIRTATRAMQTYHHFKSNPELLEDPEDFMAQIYGNEPRKLQDKSDVEDKSDVTSDLDEEENDDDEEQDFDQHGGPGFEPGFFPDEAEPVIIFKSLVDNLSRKFLQAERYSVQDKVNFIIDLINWLEAQRKILSK